MRRFDSLANAIATERRVRDVILDGEIVVISDGRPDFYSLMMNRKPASYVAFDVLWMNGRGLRAFPLRRRKRGQREAGVGDSLHVERVSRPRVAGRRPADEIELEIEGQLRPDPLSKEKNCSAAVLAARQCDSDLIYKGAID